MTTNTMHVWVWRSPDGDFYFTSKQKAVAKVEQVFPGGKWRKVANSVDMEYQHVKFDEEECWVVRVDVA